MDNYKFIFCTVITNSHKYLAETLFASLKRNCEVGYTVILYVLVTDSALDKNCDNLEIIYLNLETINDVPFAEEIINKYQNVNDDFLRWSLKPILLRYVITNLAKNTIYVDSDVFFFDNYKFLFDKFLDYDCMLSPHFRTLEPKVWPLNFEKNFTDGLYNGGFFGIGSKL